MFFTTLVLITGLCLLLPFTRLYGVIGTMVLLYFYPYHTLTLLGALVLGGVAYLYFNYRRRRNAL